MLREGKHRSGGLPVLECCGYLFYLAYCLGLLFVDLIFLSPTKGPVGKDISCGWIIDASLLFSVCVLRFHLLRFKGPNDAFIQI